ncbi:MAG: DUF6057 family protein [Planctomycetota bacterium]|jgi:hypothetical protein
MVIEYEQKSSRRTFGVETRSALFFILFFLFIYFWVDPALIYHSSKQYLFSKIYIPGMNTFADLPPYPGQATEHLAARLSHFYYYSWAGTLIITIVGWLLCFGTDRLLSALGANKLRPLRFIPPILLLMQYCRYYHYLDENLAILIALLFLYLYMRMPLRSDGFRFVIFLVLSVIMYAVAIKAYAVFVLLCGTFEFVNRRRWVIATLCILSALLIPCAVVRCVFDMDLIRAYRNMLPFHPKTPNSEIPFALSIFLFFPVVGFGCVLRRLFILKGETGWYKSRQPNKFLEYYLKSRLKWTWDTLILLIVVSGVVFLTCDNIARKHRRIDYFASRRMWTELLSEVDKLPRQYYDMFVCHDVNRTLYHTGRLLYDMFSYPQHHSGLLLSPKKSLEGRNLMRKLAKSSNTLYELGHINTAENCTCEVLAVMNYYPEGLQRLALINIVKGQTQAARVYLCALSKDFLYEDWAKNYLRRLEKDPLLSTDDQIRRTRSFMLLKDSTEKTTPKDLLLRNEHNQMAFEYLMAFCLLTNQYAPVAQSVAFLDNFDYPQGRIPTHMEEALMLYTVITGQTIDLKGRLISLSTARRFEEFWQRARQYGDNMEAAVEELKKDFGDTYYYYYISNESESVE